MRKTKQRGLMPKCAKTEADMNEAIADGLARRLPVLILIAVALIAIVHAAIASWQ